MVKQLLKTTVGVIEWYCIGTVIICAVKGIGELVISAIDQI